MKRIMRLKTTDSQYRAHTHAPCIYNRPIVFVLHVTSFEFFSGFLYTFDFALHPFMPHHFLNATLDTIVLALFCYFRNVTSTSPNVVCCGHSGHSENAIHTSHHLHLDFSDAKFKILCCHINVNVNDSMDGE